MPAEDRECALADLDEEFELRADRDGRRRAGRWYRGQVWHSIAPSLRRRMVGRASELPLPAARVRWFGTVQSAVHHAWRRLIARPAIPILVVALLALAIGLTTATFAILDSTLIRPLPFRDSDRLVVLSPRSGVTTALRDAWRQAPVFDGLEAAAMVAAEIKAPAGVRRERGAVVTPGLFQMLGVTSMRGRVFDAGDHGQTVLLSETLWRNAFDANPAIIGQAIRVGEDVATVIGILPGSFRFPSHQARFWMPLDQRQAGVSSPTMQTYARLAQVPADDARQVAAGIALRFGLEGAERRVRLTSLAGELAGSLSASADHRRVVVVLFASAVLVFVVLCGNATSLLLAQSTMRQRDFGVCSALGASSGRLLWQGALEHGVLGVASAALGLWLARSFLALVEALIPSTILSITLNPIDIDWRTTAMAALLGVATVVISGVLPAWLGTRADVVQSLRGSQSRATPVRSVRALTQGLLVAEIAVASTLLLGAALLVRTVGELARAHRGVDATNVFTGTVRVSDAVTDPGGAHALVTALESDLEAAPDIEEVAVSDGVPAPATVSYRAPQPWLSDRAGAMPVDLAVNVHLVQADYFRLYRIPIVGGRTFAAGDAATDVIVGERFAGALWPHENPVGRSFSLRATRHRVVGVARETTFPTLDEQRDRAEIYQSFESSTDRNLDLSIRCHSTCAMLSSSVERIAAAHPAVTIGGLRPLEDRYQSELDQPRTTAAVGLGFAALALVVASCGIFAVLSQTVVQRHREFGIRLALGASPGAIRRLVLRDGGLTAAFGVGAGAAFGWMAVRVFSTIHYGVTPADPQSWIGIGGVVALTALAAAWRPARQASRANPVELLRAD